MQLNMGEEYYYWGSSLPPEDAIKTGIAAYKLKYDALPTVIFCNPAVLIAIENLYIGLQLAANKNLNLHVFAFELPNKGK